MPWCSGKVTVPLGCSTALVMNRRPGHAPQLLPLPVDAPAGAARALTETAAAASAVKPSAILKKLDRSLLSDLTTVCPFCYWSVIGLWPWQELRHQVPFRVRPSGS